MTQASLFKNLSMVAVLSLSFAGKQAIATDWPVFGGNWDHQRHAVSTQITPDNIQQLAPAWEFDTGITSSFQATPIVVNGVMYVSLPFNHVVALQADTGQQLWRYTHDRIKDRPMCCGPANRGVAVNNGKVFMGTVDSRLLALDARTGQKLWDIDVTKGEQGVQEDAATLGSQLDTRGGKLEVSGASGAGINMAPMVFDGKVIVGSAYIDGMNLDPGSTFDIKVGRNSVVLTAAAAD